MLFSRRYVSMLCVLSQNYLMSDLISSNGVTESFQNKFGSITVDRLTYYTKKGWFSSASREDIALKQIVSVKYQTDRKILLGITLLVAGLILSLALIGLLLLPIAILLLWGIPSVYVVTAGGTAHTSFGWPWQSQEAEGFVAALRGVLFDT